MDFKKLLALICHNKASELFITAGRPPCMNIDGELTDVSETVLNKEQAFKIVESIMTQAQRQTFERTKDCQFVIDYPDLGRFRVSAFTQRGAAGMVLHPVEHNIPDVEALNLPPILKSLIMEKSGLIIFVGEAGSGKSTSLAALIKHRNQHSRGHILTIEDPIKFQHSHLGCMVTQREVGIDTESYEVALKNAAYQAPTVIFIGEIKNRETMQNALMFAKKGCLCLATLHEQNVIWGINRILHFFPVEMREQLLKDLASNIKGVVAQKLIKSENTQKRYPAVEILLNTPLAQSYIYEGEIFKLKDVMTKSEELGMQTLDGALFHLYQAHKISWNDALRSYIYSGSELALRMRMASAPKSIDSKSYFHLVDDEEDDHGIQRTLE